MSRRTTFALSLPSTSGAGRLDTAGVAIPFLAVVCLTVSHYHGSVQLGRSLVVDLPRVWQINAIAPELFWFGASVVLYLVVPLLSLVVLREPLREYGLDLGHWRLGLSFSTVALLVMVPGAIILSGRTDFSQYYPMARAARLSRELFFWYELGYVTYFIAWEYLFRSFLLVGLYRRIGVYAVYVLALPFALLHVGKPELEVFISLAAAVFLGYLALWTRSFWWGTLVHASVAVTMDVSAVWSRLFN